MVIRGKLIDKIQKDTGIKIKLDWEFRRPTLNWSGKSAGRMIWYFINEEKNIIGSSEKMLDLLKSNKIQLLKDGCFFELSSS